MVNTLLEGKYLSLRPLTMEGVGIGFNSGTSTWSWVMSQVGEHL